MVAVTTAALLAAAVTAILAINATIASKEANFRRGQAEDLIDFMLGDLQGELREIGRLDIYESVGDKALEYFSALDHEDDSDTSLKQRARNLRQIGNVREERAAARPSASSSRRPKSSSSGCSRTSPTWKTRARGATRSTPSC